MRSADYISSLRTIEQIRHNRLDLPVVELKREDVEEGFLVMLAARHLSFNRVSGKYDGSDVVDYHKEVSEGGVPVSGELLIDDLLQGYFEVPQGPDKTVKVLIEPRGSSGDEDFKNKRWSHF